MSAMVAEPQPERDRRAARGRMPHPLEELDRLGLQTLGQLELRPGQRQAARVTRRCQRAYGPSTRSTQLASRLVSASIAARSPTNHKASTRHRRPHISTSARPVDVPMSTMRSANRPSSSMSSGPLVASCRAVSASMRRSVSSMPSARRRASSLAAWASCQRPQYTAACVLSRQQPDPGLLLEGRSRQRLGAPLVDVAVPRSVTHRLQGRRRVREQVRRSGAASGRDACPRRGTRRPQIAVVSRTDSQADLEPSPVHRIHGGRDGGRQVPRDLAVVRTLLPLQRFSDPPVEIGPIRQRHLSFGRPASRFVREPDLAGVGRADEHALLDRPVHRGEALDRIQLEDPGHHREANPLTHDGSGAEQPGQHLLVPPRRGHARSLTSPGPRRQSGGEGPHMTAGQRVRRLRVTAASSPSHDPHPERNCWDARPIHRERNSTQARIRCPRFPGTRAVTVVPETANDSGTERCSVSSPCVHDEGRINVTLPIHATSGLSNRRRPPSGRRRGQAAHHRSGSAEEIRRRVDPAVPVELAARLTGREDPADCNATEPRRCAVDITGFDVLRDHRKLTVR